MKAIETLRVAVESYEPYLHASGELHDPILDEPTQYGTPCHAYCQAVLATRLAGSAHEERIRAAFLGLDASLRYIEDPHRQPPAAEFDAATGTVTALDHRDYFWAPSVKTFRLLKREGVSMADAFSRRIAAIDITTSFKERPPNGRAASWLVGEWVRMQLGLSPVKPARFDTWLDDLLQTCLVPEHGFCQEPGHGNATDLFIRHHLATLMVEGYNGAHQEALDALLETGLARTIGLQLSDGSLASTHRCVGQTWTVGILVAYFTLAARYFADRDPARAKQARHGAQLAYLSFVRWQRPDDTYSPVENLLPGTYRVGYEPFTMDGHYANRAMQFLAEAILYGFRSHGHRMPNRDANRVISHAPLHRAAIHGGPYSAYINADPDPDYDGFGVTDLTFGPDRMFHFVSAARHEGTGALFQLGLAVRDGPGRSPIHPIAQAKPTLSGPIEPGLSESSLRLRAQVRGAMYGYELNVWIDEDGVQIEESTPDHIGYKSLLIPYVRTMGEDYETHVRVVLSPQGAVVRFRYRNEYIRLRLVGAVEHSTHLTYGYQSRRGLCGLLRIDLREPTDVLRYRLSIGR